MNNHDLGELKFSSLFGERRVLCGLEDSDRDGAIKALVDLLVTTGCRIHKEQATRAVVERENLVCTAISPGLAIPHARLNDLEEVAVAVATSKKGISFGPRAAGAVHLIILILTPTSAPGAYLQALAAVARFFSKPETAKKVAALPKAQ
jgi:mannitol/fructose-specific phosphotransferase system IIA component (Ntr-type)